MSMCLAIHCGVLTRSFDLGFCYIVYDKFVPAKLNNTRSCNMDLSPVGVFLSSVILLVVFFVLQADDASCSVGAYTSTPLLYLEHSLHK